MASGRVKGITIEIDGNTTKLQTALKGVDSSLSKTQHSLKDVNRLLKFDPKNTELLTQKQNLLKKAISDTKDKLKTLKDAEKQAQKAFAEGKISQDQYDALKREIADTENKLKSLKKEASTVSRVFTEFGNKMKKTGEAVKGVGEKMMPISAGAAAAGIACGKMAIDFEDSMANINTLLDDDSHLAGYEKATKDLSNETGLNLQTVADGMYQTISSIGDGGKETEKIFMTMGKSAKAGGAEVADSVSLISAGMKGYNQVNDETAQKISDLAFQTAKLGVTTFPEMARSMQPLFPLSSSLNMSYEELFGTMATLTGVTGNTSEVTTQLKAVMSNLMKPTEGMADLMQKYGYESGAAMIESEGLQGTLAILQKETGGQSDKLAKLFSSTEALTAVTALTGPQFDVFGEKLAAMGDSAGATETAYGKLNTQGDEMRRSMNELKNAGVEFGGALMETLAPTISAVADGIHGLVEWFSGLNDGQQQALTILTIIVGLAGPTLMFLGGLISSIGSISSALGALSGFLAGTGTAGTAAGIGLTAVQVPILPIIAGITALIAIGVLLWKNWDTIKEKAGQLAKSMSQKWTDIKNKTTEVWNGIKTAITEKIQAAKDKANSTIDALKNGAIEKWNSLKSSAQSVFESVKNLITHPIQTAKDKVKGEIEKMKSFFKFKWELPKLKMPHFSISGKFSLNPPSAPSFGIKWYKKAMDKIHILKNASIFGSMGGQFLGGGEAGEEIVAGKQHMLDMIRQATSTNNVPLINAIMRSTNMIVSRMEACFERYCTRQLVLDTGVLAGELSPKIDRNLGKVSDWRRRDL